jgi:hypothetical protein
MVGVDRRIPPDEPEEATTSAENSDLEHLVVLHKSPTKNGMIARHLEWKERVIFSLRGICINVPTISQVSDDEKVLFEQRPGCCVDPLCRSGKQR